MFFVEVARTMHCIDVKGRFENVKTELFNQLLNIMEKSSPDIYKHSERVAMMCYEFAKRFEIDPREREILYWAGFLHEIGKVGWGDIVSIKDAEYGINQLYPYFSKSVLLALDEPRIANIIVQHMEQLDGEGYPQGINANDIHLFATMIRMCDYYDECRTSGDTHSAASAKIRKLTDVIFPKKMITPFIKMLVSDEDLDLWSNKLR